MAKQKASMQQALVENLKAVYWAGFFHTPRSGNDQSDLIFSELMEKIGPRFALSTGCIIRVLSMRLLLDHAVAIQAV